MNFTRSLSAARLAHGLQQLTFDEMSWEIVLDMHENVRNAAELQDIVTHDHAEEACRIITSLVKLSYQSSASRCIVKPLSPGDIALDFCEYNCILKEVRQRKLCDNTDVDACQWLLARLPSTLDQIQIMRQQVVAHVKRDPDIDTGWDGGRARHVLAWWLTSKRRPQPR